MARRKWPTRVMPVRQERVAVGRCGSLYSDRLARKRVQSGVNRILTIFRWARDADLRLGLAVSHPFRQKRAQRMGHPGYFVEIPQWQR